MEFKKIKNTQELAKNHLRRSVLEIIEIGLGAIDTRSVIRNNILFNGTTLSIMKEDFSVSNINRIFIVGVGKCSFQAAAEIEEILGDKVSGGVVVDLHQHRQLKRITYYKGDHPFPTEANVSATKNIISLLKSLKENDLVIFIISGGGSALLCQPDDMTCEQEKTIFSYLGKNGATIKEINTVRKHISLARGGFLAKYAYPAHRIALIFSDVLGDDLNFIASGPTVKDSTTCLDAENVLKKYDAWEKYGINSQKLIETPKEEIYFSNMKNILLLSNHVALDAMAEHAKRLGYQFNIRTLHLAGEAREAGEYIGEELHKAETASVLLYGGETTVTLNGDGKGGRNQELVLSALRSIREGELIVSINSDGMDNSDVAGALCDILTKECAEKLGLNIQKYLDVNNSYEFFQKTGDFIYTEYTGSNISDLVVAIKK